MKQTVLLIRNAAKDDFGGAETYQVSLGKVLQQNELNPIIVTGSPKLITYAKHHNIKVIKGWWWSKQNWSGINAVLFPFYALWQFILSCWYISLILKTNASVLHIQSKDDFIGATIAGKIMRKRVIWTDHMDLRYIFQNIKHPFRNPVGKVVHYAGMMCDHLILISNNEYALVTGCIDHNSKLRDKITIINNGVIDQKKSIKHYRTSPTFTFCIASRIVTNKGIGEAIISFSNLSKSKASFDAELSIYGDGPDTEEFKELARNVKGIVFYGHHSNVIDRISASDVFILPSYQEGFSIALLEATMLGKPIIASDIDSNSEIIHHNSTGLLVKVRDTDSLSTAMWELYSKPELRQKLEIGARKSYEKHYNLETIVRNSILPLYLG